MAAAPQIKEIGAATLAAMAEALQEFDKSTEAKCLGITLNKQTMDKCMADAQPQMEALFEHYDTCQQGYWTEIEAATFFGHFATAWPLAEFQNMEKQAQFKMVMNFVGLERGPEGKQEEFEQVKLEELKKLQSALQSDLDKQSSEYFKNKEARDTQAFKFVDSNRDGRIALSELTAALTPSHEKHKEMIGALGLLAGEKPVKFRGDPTTCGCDLM